MSPADQLKKQAALAAAQSIKDGMKVGLGTGSTVYFAIEEVARRIREEGLQIQAVSTSFNTTLLCQKWGIPLLDLGSVHQLDLAIDGADEVTPERHLTKGRGAAHTLEKIVAKLAREFYVVADTSKKVQKLGEKMPVPVEFLPSSLAGVERHLRELGAEKIVLRMAEKGKDGPVISDSGLFLADAYFGMIASPSDLEKEINAIPGVLDNGIFAGIATKAFLAGPESVEILG